MTNPKNPTLSERALAAAGMCQTGEAAQRQLSAVPARNVYREGPMGYLAQQIVKRMGAMGWPCKVSELFRTPERQAQLYGKNSKAKPWQSPHQYGLAADIIHASKGWNVPERFWDDLAAVVKVVSEEYNVPLEHGHYWRFRDSAHVELKDFRRYRDRWGKRAPDQNQMDIAFREVLPKVWAAYIRFVPGAQNS